MDSIVNTLGAYLGQGVAWIVVAVLVLIIGWLIARFIAGLIGETPRPPRGGQTREQGD